ncbi:hypothetical protein SKAU_G00260650, partial [Synaphobranchus kaupii]
GGISWPDIMYFVFLNKEVHVICSTLRSSVIHLGNVVKINKYFFELKTTQTTVPRTPSVTLREKHVVRFLDKVM